MKLHKTIERLFLGGVLFWAAGTCGALTLGKARGAVLLGQPLSLTIVLQYEAGEASADWCFDADVYYGDVRQEGSRVSAMPISSDTGVLNGVRVIAAAPIDEPVVTVYLRSGCGTKTSRKYVLLSDLVSDVVPASSDIAPKSVLSTTAQKVQPYPGPSIRTEKVEATSGKPLKTASRSPKSESAKSSAQPLIASAQIVAQRPRLKISILDLLDIRNPDLRLSNELKATPSENSQTREDAKTLWRSLNTSQGDVLRDDVQQRAISANLQSLKELSVKNQMEMQELAQRLSKAESDRFANPLAIVLASLLIATVLACIAMFAKLRAATGKNKPWWSGNDVDDDDVDDDSHHTQIAVNQANVTGVSMAAAHVGGAALTKKPVASGSPVIPQSLNASLDLDLDLSSPLPLRSTAGHGAAQSPLLVSRQTVPAMVHQRDFSHSLNATLHAINTQEMLDVRQQADFFMTLGQHEEAISLLETSIRESDESNPLVYLDLLKVLHTLSRKPEFDHYRNEFNAIFTGWAPQYAVFGQPGNSLDAYPQICAEISQIWGSESALEFLEQCMIRSPEDASEHYFDLDAFRDLLLLHAIAGRIRRQSSSDSGFLPFSAMRVAVNPNEMIVDTDKQKVSQSIEPVGPNLMLDDPEAASVKFRTSQVNRNLIDFDASGPSESINPRKSK